MIDRSWLAELPAAADQMHPTATGILIDGNDHDVTNVVVWSMLVGVHIKSGGDTMVRRRNISRYTGLGHKYTASAV